MSSVLTENDINNLGDLLQAFQLMQSLQVDYRGVASLEDAKCRLLQYIRDKFGAGLHRHSNAADLMKGVLEVDREHRMTLETLYSAALTYFMELPKVRKEELERNIPGFEQSIKDNMTSIKKNDCAILVAGEVSAGKSSLLNLLLGQDLLPTSLLSCTSVMCELKHKDDKYAIAHHWDSTRPADWLDLSGPDPMSVLAKYVHQIGEREDKFPYKRVEVFWPFPLLQGGIFIVDSPGIGESREMTDLVRQYLPSAFAFIYVINSSNAGGLQPDRLQDLLAELSKRNDELSTFDPRSAIFVFNKWDQVPPDETEMVRRDTMMKLKRCWPGVDPSQVFTMSTLNASKSLSDSGFVTSDFAKLLEGIENLLPVSLQCKLENHYRWLSMLLRRSSFYLRVYIANETRSDEDRKELTEYLHNQLDKMETESKRVATELKLELHKKTNTAYDQLIAHLASASTRCRLMTWEEAECPDGDDWDVLQEVLVAKVNKKVRREVSEWDTKNNIFTDLQIELIQKFQTEFELMEDQLAIVEGDMMGRGSRPVDAMAMMRNRLRTEDKPWLTMGQKVALGLAAPILIPLGVVAGMFVLPVAGVKAIKNKLQDLQSLKEYRACKVETMALMTDEILENFLERSNLTKLIGDQLQRVTQNTDCMIKSIPNIIDADRIMINRLQEEREATETSLADQYLPLYHKCQALQGKLDYFYATKVRKYDISFHQLDWEPANPPIASGSFGDVYAAVWHMPTGEMKEVAIKVRREIIDECNVSDILLEEGNLRRFHHNNIVKYYGTCIRRNVEKGTLQYMMVMECCETTLRTRITGEDALNPGKLGSHNPCRRRALKNMCQYVAQICNALMYLHGRGLVHRDLKPQNILIDSQDTIKLADVGLTKMERDISGTKCGSACYAAPEVLEGSEYNKAADIYSLGIITWELWYGRLAQDDIASTHQGDIEKAMREGVRPNIMAIHEPPDDWKDLITLMWGHEGSKRPNATEVFDFFDKLA